MLKTQVKQESKPNLYPFKDVIKIEVEVNDIYKKLVETFPEDYKHKEILSHAIIGSCQQYGKLAYIYNALAGFTNDVDFKIGDKVDCTEKKRQMWEEETEPMMPGDTSKPTQKWKSKDEPIGECEVVEIDLYSGNKLKVKFMECKWKSNEMTEVEKWVDHKDCTKWSNRPQLVDTWVDKG